MPETEAQTKRDKDSKEWGERRIARRAENKERHWSTRPKETEESKEIGDHRTDRDLIVVPRSNEITDIPADGLNAEQLKQLSEVHFSRGLAVMAQNFEGMVIDEVDDAYNSNSPKRRQSARHFIISTFPKLIPQEMKEDNEDDFFAGLAATITAHGGKVAFAVEVNPPAGEETSDQPVIDVGPAE